MQIFLLPLFCYCYIVSIILFRGSKTRHKCRVHILICSASPLNSSVWWEKLIFVQLLCNAALLLFSQCRSWLSSTGKSLIFFFNPCKKSKKLFLIFPSDLTLTQILCFIRDTIFFSASGSGWGSFWSQDTQFLNRLKDALWRKECQLPPTPGLCCCLYITPPLGI